MPDVDKDERIFRVTVKLSMEEQEMVQEAARLQGLSPAAYLRMLGLTQARAAKAQLLMQSR